MRFFQKPEVQTLSEWLDLATNKLTAPAKERIKAEIEGHYADAVEAYLKNGSSESDARALALADLGDAYTAAKRFRSRHLTESDTKCLKNWTKGGYMLPELVINYLMFGLFTTDQLPLRQNALVSSSHPILFLAGEFLVLIALPTACIFMARHNPTKPKLRLLLLMQSVSGLCIGLGLDMLFRHSSEVRAWIYFCLVCLVWGGVHLRLWNKLGKTGSDWNQTPPPNTAQI